MPNINLILVLFFSVSFHVLDHSFILPDLHRLLMKTDTIPFYSGLSQPTARMGDINSSTVKVYHGVSLMMTFRDLSFFLHDCRIECSCLYPCTPYRGIT